MRKGTWTGLDYIRGLEKKNSRGRGGLRGVEGTLPKGKREGGVQRGSAGHQGALGGGRPMCNDEDQRSKTEKRSGGVSEAKRNRQREIKITYPPRVVVCIYRPAAESSRSQKGTTVCRNFTMSTVVTTGVSETPAVAADLFYYKQYFVKENNECGPRQQLRQARPGVEAWQP